MLRPARKVPAQKAHSENPMTTPHYIGFDVHKKTISFCVKTAAGEVLEEGVVAAQRSALQQWAAARRQPWQGRAGGDPVQRLDLRHLAALQRAVADGASRQDEGHQRGQEEERQHRCPHHRRSGALQSFTGLLCGGATHPRTAPPVALPPPGGERSGAHEKQDGRTADGDRRTLCEGEAAWQEILRQPAGRTGRGAGVGDRSAASEPGGAGDVREHAAQAGARVTCRPRADRTGGAVDQHSRGGTNHGFDLGAGDRRPAPLWLRLPGHELLWPHRRTEVFGGQAAARADLETAQPLAAKHADRGGQTGAALEPATGGAACARVGARTSQPGHAGGGAQTGSLSAGGRQKRAELSAAGAVARGRSEGGRGAKNQNRLGRKNLRTNGDRPAVPRQHGTGQRSFGSRCLLTGCIEAGRQTLTHTSWTGLRFGSRKWMSGQAAALAACNDRRLLAKLIVVSTLREMTLASEWRPPSPLDFYLSWMSRERTGTRIITIVISLR